MFGKLFKKSMSADMVGAKVTVFTEDNWEPDGAGGAPGEIMQVGYHVTVLWKDGDETRTDEFDRRTQRCDRTRLGLGKGAWFRLAGQDPEPDALEK